MLAGMIVLDPKSQFLELEETARNFGNAVHHPAVQTALTYALSEFAIRELPSTEQMNAVNAFVQIFLNMAEKAKAMPTFPDKRLRTETLIPAPGTKQPTANK